MTFQIRPQNYIPSGGHDGCDHRHGGAVLPQLHGVHCAPDAAGGRHGRDHGSLLRHHHGVCGAEVPRDGGLLVPAALYHW